jgi:hypothetical protein
VSRKEVGIVVGATAGPLALIGVLMLGGHPAPDPAPPGRRQGRAVPGPGAHDCAGGAGVSDTSELERLQAELERSRDATAAAVTEVQSQMRRAEKAEAERDALKATVQRVQSIAGQWVAQAAAADDGDELVPVLANVGRTILRAALNTPTPTTRTETA